MGSSTSKGPRLGNDISASEATATKKRPPSAGATSGGARKAGARAKTVEYVAPEGAAWVNEDGKLTAVPPDFLSTKHKPLAKARFVDEATYYFAVADKLAAKADKFRKLGEDSKKLGNVTDKGKAKKLLKVQQSFDKIRKELEDSMGPDAVAALLAGMQKDLTAGGDKPAATEGAPAQG